MNVYHDQKNKSTSYNFFSSINHSDLFIKLSSSRLKKKRDKKTNINRMKGNNDF